MSRAVCVMAVVLGLLGSIGEAAERRWVVTVDNGKPAGELLIRCTAGS